jgi:3-phenylpropionate/trans-cinnamate dioxygenase ferredoxin subunit
MRVFTVGDSSVLVVNLGGRFTAVEPTCTHEGEPLVEGMLTSSSIVCAYHGSEFDLFTGEAIGPPAEDPLRVYAVAVDDDQITLDRAPEPADR